MNPRAAPLRVLARLALALVLLIPGRASADTLLVFAAASLTNALNQVGQAWTETTGQSVVMSYAGSPALARQIQAGAPADLFISASEDWLDTLISSGDLRRETRRNLLGNRLVLIAHGQDAPPVPLGPQLNLLSMLDGGRLSMAMVDAVPAGIYGKAALTHLGLWDAVATSVAQSDNVRTALNFVVQGEAPLGIVYATDAAVADNVSIVATFPADSHAPITYPAAITTQSRHPQAAAFLEFLSSDTARSIWTEFGFLTID